MKHIIFGVIIVALLNIAHAESNVEKYKQVYIEQITPILEKQFKDALATEADPQAKLKLVAEGMANCQIETLSAYPQKYQDASINPVAEGGDLSEVTKQVNEMMKTDIESGTISKEDFTAMVESATEKYINCTKALEKEL
ncbi:MAG: hypothetical protein GKR92_08145 [Gammaproteobacteria bacterium]|nr:MAG: hypothetical protein GKR92_08145 [Gammaproteobacteria bacterium]